MPPPQRPRLPLRPSWKRMLSRRAWLDRSAHARRYTPPAAMTGSTAPATALPAPRAVPTAAPPDTARRRTRPPPAAWPSPPPRAHHARHAHHGAPVARPPPRTRSPRRSRTPPRLAPYPRGSVSLPASAGAAPTPWPPLPRHAGASKAKRARLLSGFMWLPPRRVVRHARRTCRRRALAYRAPYRAPAPAHPAPK